MKKIASLFLALLLVFSVLTAAIAVDIGGTTNEPPPDLPEPPIPDLPSEPDPNTPSVPSVDPDVSEPPNAEGETPSDSDDSPEESQPSAEPTTPEETTPPTVATTPTAPPQTEYWSNMPYITKHPTNETIPNGGCAEFVARAEFSLTIIWHLISPDGDTDILAKNAPNYFGGLAVYGLETERLILDRVPVALNGWAVQAEFVGRGLNNLSTPAFIYVQIPLPTISVQPLSVSLKPDEATILQAGATSTDSQSTMLYQWYQTTSNSTMGGRAIDGATNASYMPDYIPGTMYYYCAIRASSGTEITSPVKTDCAAVTYPEAPVPTTAPTTAPAAPTQAAHPTTAPTEAFHPSTEATQPETLPLAIHAETTFKSNTLLMGIVIFIIALAVAGIIATIVILRSSSRNRVWDDDEVYEGEDSPEEIPVFPDSPTSESAAEQDPDDDIWAALASLDLFSENDNK